MKITKNYLFILFVLSSANVFADEAPSAEGTFIGFKAKSEAFPSLSVPELESSSNMSPVEMDYVEYAESIPSLSTALIPTDFSLSGPECRSSANPMGRQPIFSLMYDVNTLNMYNNAKLNSSMSSCNLNLTRYLYRESRFNLSRCENLFKCQGVKLSYVESSKKEKLQEMLNNLSAKEFAKNFFKSKVDSMEKLELLKKFSQKNFDSKIGQSCASRFAATESVQCQMSSVVEGFADFQKTCNVTQVGCYNGSNIVNDVPGYFQFNAKFKPNSGEGFQAYFDTRTDSYARRYSNLDKAYVQNLGDLVNTENFINSSDEEKETMFINALKETGARDGIYVDPVLNADFNLAFKDVKSIKESDQYKGLKAIVLEKNLTKNEFISRFNNYRKARSESILKDSCSKVPTVENICKSTTSLKFGNRSPVDIDNISMANIMSEKAYSSESAEVRAIKEMTGGLWDEGDLETMLDSKKCYTFGYADFASRYERNRERDRGKKGERETDFNNMGSTEGGKRGSKSGAGDSGMDDETLKSMGLGKTAVREESMASKDESTLSTFEDEDKSYPQQNYVEDAYANNYFNQNAFNTPSHFVDKDYVKEDVAEQKNPDSAVTKNESESSSASDAKIADLVKKLAATEDRLDKLKASTEAADEARAKEKKIAEENALISELKGQISELKNKAATVKPAAAQAPAADRREEMRFAPQSSNFSISSRNNSESRDRGHESDAVEKRGSQGDKGSSSSAQSSSTSQSGKSIASSIQLNAVNSDSGNEQSNGMVLTRVDGMSSEKAIETIANKIMELNGVPFLIEEDGVTKKVIPLIRNGKIELDENGQPKFVKIKVARKECSDEEKSKGKCRAPASVAAKSNDSVADEKRDQEQRIKREIERAQYLKLKALTNKAISTPSSSKKP